MVDVAKIERHLLFDGHGNGETVVRKLSFEFSDGV